VPILRTGRTWKKKISVPHVPRVGSASSSDNVKTNHLASPYLTSLIPRPSSYLLDQTKSPKEVLPTFLRTVEDVLCIVRGTKHLYLYDTIYPMPQELTSYIQDTTDRPTDRPTDGGKGGRSHLTNQPTATAGPEHYYKPFSFSFSFFCSSSYLLPWVVVSDSWKRVTVRYTATGDLGTTVRVKLLNTYLPAYVVQTYKPSAPRTFLAEKLMEYTCSRHF